MGVRQLDTRPGFIGSPEDENVCGWDRGRDRRPHPIQYLHKMIGDRAKKYYTVPPPGFWAECSSTPLGHISCFPWPPPCLPFRLPPLAAVAPSMLGSAATMPTTVAPSLSVADEHSIANCATTASVAATPNADHRFKPTQAHNSPIATPVVQCTTSAGPFLPPSDHVSL